MCAWYNTKKAPEREWPCVGNSLPFSTYWTLLMTLMPTLKIFLTTSNEHVFFFFFYCTHEDSYYVLGLCLKGRVCSEGVYVMRLWINKLFFIFLTHCCLRKPVSISNHVQSRIPLGCVTICLYNRYMCTPDCLLFIGLRWFCDALCCPIIPSK